MFRDILKCMEHINGSNNYRQNIMFVTMEHNGIYVSTACVNDYGNTWSNEDGQIIPFDNLSNYIMRKLFL